MNIQLSNIKMVGDTAEELKIVLSKARLEAYLRVLEQTHADMIILSQTRDEQSVKVVAKRASRF